MTDQTAYAKSQQAALQLMKSVQKEQTEQERLAAIKAMHKKAFRVAFNMLERDWPPENTAEYWKLVTDRTALDYHDNKGNLLCELLMLAVTEYLEKVSKEGEQHNGGTQAETKTA